MSFEEVTPEFKSVEETKTLPVTWNIPPASSAPADNKKAPTLPEFGLEFGTTYMTSSQEPQGIFSMHSNCSELVLDVVNHVIENNYFPEFGTSRLSRLIAEQQNFIDTCGEVKQ